MLPPRHYPHAPIKEALIDLLVVNRDDISLQDLKQFGVALKEQYPFESPRELMQAQFQFGGPAPSSSHSTIGYLFHSSDRKQAVQARLNGFTFSRFEPYLDWQSLREEALRLWSTFVEITRPKSVQRIALRYVNQLNLPLKNGTLEFDDYLRTFLRFGEEAGKEQILEQFFIRLVLPQEDLKARLVLTEALLPASNSDTIGVILDIDLFRENISLPTGSQELWAILDDFRNRKNEYFEGAITDAARELFQ